MSLILSGTDGLSDVDGSDATPAIRGTDANTGIFFPAADTIGFSEGGVEAMRINSSGNVGIGTASPVSRLHVTGSGSPYISVTSTNTYNFVQALDGSGLAIGTASSATNKDILFYSGSVERMRILSTGNILSLLGGSTTATGTGITFPATQSASSDANTLDDYEEGTWTPTVVGSSTAGTYTVVPVGCVYTKIGRMVALQFNIQFSAASGGSGQIVIGNLPFGMNNSGLAAPGALTARFLDTTASTSNGLSAMRTSGTAGVTSFGMVLAIDNANWEIISISAISTSTEIVGQLTYIA